MNERRGTLGFLILGAGARGATRAAALALAHNARLVAVHDVDPRAADLLAARHRAAAPRTLEEALEHPEVDAVIVATPHSEHFGQAMAALEAGKHVLCEKPLAIHPTEARQLAVRADELRLRLATGLDLRFAPPVAEALEIVGAWRIGRVEGVRVEVGSRPRPTQYRGWRTVIEQSGGGALMDLGPQACDLLRRFLGEVVAVKGYRREAVAFPKGCEVEAYALFRDFDRGFGELRVSWTQPTGGLALEVRGSEGWIRAETEPWRLGGVDTSGRPIIRNYLVERATERAFRARHGCERSLVREIEAFVTPGMSRPRLEGTGWDGCRVTEMISALYASDDSGEEVRLQPLLAHLPSMARRRELNRIGRVA